MMISYKIILQKEEKKIFKKDFLNLFEIVYGKKLDEKSWEHQFLNSPYNNSPLFLALDGNKIVGSALMIEQKCIIDKKECNYFLFTTSAILKEFRSKGIYAEMLKIQKEYAEKNNIDFIFAFPNKLAYPVLKLFGRFKGIKKTNLIKTNFDNIDFDSFKNSLIIDNKMFQWRFEHKNYLFYTKDNKIIIFKEFDESYDILAVYDKSNFNFSFVETTMNSSFRVNILEQNIKNIEELEVLETVNASYFPIKKDINYTKLDINLLMSDVF